MTVSDETQRRASVLFGIMAEPPDRTKDIVALFLSPDERVVMGPMVLPGWSLIVKTAALTCDPWRPDADAARAVVVWTVSPTDSIFEQLRTGAPDVWIYREHSTEEHSTEDQRSTK